MKKPASASAIDKSFGDLARRAVEAARAARERAYAPYSNYRVGAALVTGNDTIIAGCNVENASYGLTICAERVAITRAIVEGQQRFQLLVVATENAGSPCGACLQVASEFCTELPILLIGDDAAHFVETRLEDLLPRAFYSAKIQSAGETNG